MRNNNTFRPIVDGYTLRFSADLNQIAGAQEMPLKREARLSLLDRWHVFLLEFQGPP